MYPVGKGIYTSSTVCTSNYRTMVTLCTSCVHTTLWENAIHIFFKIIKVVHCNKEYAKCIRFACCVIYNRCLCTAERYIAVEFKLHTMYVYPGMHYTVFNYKPRDASTSHVSADNIDYILCVFLCFVCVRYSCTKRY